MFRSVANLLALVIYFILFIYLFLLRGGGGGEGAVFQGVQLNCFRVIVDYNYEQSLFFLLSSSSRGKVIVNFGAQKPLYLYYF